MVWRGAGGGGQTSEECRPEMCWPGPRDAAAVELFLRVPAGGKEKVTAGGKAVSGMPVPRAGCLICGAPCL